MPPTTLTSCFGYLAGRLSGPLAPEDMALRIDCLGAEGRYAISELAMETENYFRLGLERVTQSDGAKLLVFYCIRDCWMSWNAAKRALALGYKNVAWYSDGWEAAGLPCRRQSLSRQAFNNRRTCRDLGQFGCLFRVKFAVLLSFIRAE